MCSSQLSYRWGRILFLSLAVTFVLVSASCSGTRGEQTDDSTVGGADAASSATSAASSTELDCRHEFDHEHPLKLIPNVQTTLEHSTTAYTQGLLIHEGEIIETTGRVGESEIRRLDRGTGELKSATTLPATVFGEGITLVDEEFWQVTWQDERAFRWRLNENGEFELVDERNYEGEGWGLVTIPSSARPGRHDSEMELWMSNGSDTMTRHDPMTFDVLESRTVTRHNGDASDLNELEWDGTWLWANRFLTTEILRIDPDCFVVSGVVDGNALEQDAHEVASAQGGEIEVMNGIAYDSSTQTYLLTGKWWPTMYEVIFVEP